MLCPVCREEISPDMKFCGRCGAKIPRCPTCGKVIEKRMNFCLNDGTPLPEEILSVFPPMEESAKRHSPIPVLLLLMPILVGAVIGYLVFNGGLPAWRIGGKNRQDFKKSAPSYSNVTVVERPDSEWEETEAGEGVALPEEPEAEPIHLPPPVTATPTPTLTPTPTPAPVLSLSERVEDFIDHCADRAFQRKDLEGFEKDHYTLAINAIYAHAGRRFKESDERLRTYFGAKPWYYPTIDGNELYERMLNEYQVQNLYLLLSYGVEQGFRKVSTADSQLSAFISGCASRNFTVENLSELDDDMAYLARNAIYARSGWDFESGYLRGFFSRFDWYHPTTLPLSFSEEMLNDYQKHNRDVVNAYIESKGYSCLTGETARYEQVFLYA